MSEISFFNFCYKIASGQLSEGKLSRRPICIFDQLSFGQIVGGEYSFRVPDKGAYTERNFNSTSIVILFTIVGQANWYNLKL